METIKISGNAKGERLSGYLAERGVYLPLDCGGRGICGKCKVKVLSGSFKDACGAPVLPDENGCILACRAFVAGDAEIALLQSATVNALTEFQQASKGTDGQVGYGMALGGAVAALLQKEKRDAAQSFAKECQTLDLNNTPDFAEAFLKYMNF